MYCTVVVSVVIQFYPWLKVYFQLIVQAKSLNTNKSQYNLNPQKIFIIKNQNEV